MCEQLFWHVSIVLQSKCGAGVAKCALFRKLIQPLHAHGVLFDTVDMFGDARVRESVREYDGCTH